MINHAGNAANQMSFEEHDGINNAKRVTIGAVSVALPITFSGNVTLSDAKTYIGLTTTTLGVGDRYIGLVTNTPVGLHTLAPSPNFIGLATVNIGANVNTNIGLVTVSGGQIGVLGNVTLADSKAYIGLNTVTVGVGDRFIGLATVVHAGNVTLNASAAFIGLATVNIGANPNTYIGLVTVGGIGTITLADPKNYIGLTTTTLGVGDRFIGLTTVVHAGNVTLNASAAFIGLATTVLGSNVTLNQSAAFIGLATIVIGNASVAVKNAGTTKTLKIMPITLSTNSNSSIAITNTFYITSILINSNATVRLNIKSGVTYLTGNASLGVNLNPGGGWVESGSVDSPVYIGLAAASNINFEKADSSGVISQVGGKVIYFDE